MKTSTKILYHRIRFRMKIRKIVKFLESIQSIYRVIKGRHKGNGFDGYWFYSIKKIGDKKLGNLLVTDIHLNTIIEINEGNYTITKSINKLTNWFNKRYCQYRY